MQVQKRFSIGEMGSRRVRRGVGALALAAVVVLAGCSGDGSADPKAGSPTPPAVGGPATAPVTETGPGDLGTPESTPVTDPPTTEAPQVDEADTGTDPAADEPTAVDEPDETDGPAVPADGADDADGLSPGDPCSLEEGSPDCIDPDGDGEGVYLLGGAECAADAPDISLCADLDGDGHAGYPDSEGDSTPDELPPGEPCSTEEGSPDCIDADGDGEGVILRGGEECVAMYADVTLCEDVDGDGYAGQTDSEGHLPYPYEG